MKRSRIFLGLTTACLAIAGVVAAKVSHFGALKTVYYKPSGLTTCLPTKVTCEYDPNNQNICTIRSRQVFTDNACLTPFAYDGQ